MAAEKKICPYTNGKVVAKSHSYDIDKPNGINLVLIEQFALCTWRIRGQIQKAYPASTG
jgi:hypothetical protein